MDCGFETIGNATVIGHDRGPVICTDPWLTGNPYFGSWVLSHTVPERQREAVRGCRYVWLSHGHPDHLSLDSLNELRDKIILLPDHVGGRIRDDLAAQGFLVRVLPDRTWTVLSPRICVLSIADYNQDAILLIDIGGTLVVNLNDATDRGWKRFVRQTMRQYDRTFLLALAGYNDAGNVFDEDGRLMPSETARLYPTGRKVRRLVQQFPAKYFVPFSSLHRYQRTDSLWADPYLTRLPDFARGYESKVCELLPAFIRYDVRADRLERIDPPETVIMPRPPEDFGDHWSEPLAHAEKERITRYFHAVEHLGRVLDFVEFRVGGESHVVTFGKHFHRGLTLEVPRHSLMTAIDCRIFDDLFIGNFMKITCRGRSHDRALHAFAPQLAKYADNGGARTRAELRQYMAAYRRRDPVGFLRQAVDRGVVRPAQEMTTRLLRERAGEHSGAYRAARLMYRTFHRAA